MTTGPCLASRFMTWEKGASSMCRLQRGLQREACRERALFERRPKGCCGMTFLSRVLYRGACVRGALGPQRIDRQTRRRDRKGGRRSYNQTRISAPPSSPRMHATRGSTHTVTVPLPYRTPHVIPKAKLRTDQCAHTRVAPAHACSRAPAHGRSAAVILRPTEHKQEALLMVPSQKRSRKTIDETPAHAQAARTQSLGAQAAQDDRGGEGSSALLHRNAEIDMGYGPDEEKGSPGAGNTDEESDDGHDGANDMPDAYGRPEEREPEQASPHARQATASEQRAAAGISPGGRPVAASKATARRRKPNRETGPRNRETGPRTARGLRPYAALAMY